MIHDACRCGTVNFDHPDPSLLGKFECNARFLVSGSDVGSSRKTDADVWIRSRRAAGSPFAAALLALLLVCGQHCRAQVVPGDALPDFTLKSYDGKDYSIAKIRHGAKGIVVVFFSATCADFLQVVDRVNAIEKEYRNKGILFVGLSVDRDESPAALRTVVQVNNIGFPVLIDAAGKVLRSFGVRRTPEVFVFSDDGTCLYRGLLDDASRGRSPKHLYLRDAVEAALSHKTPVKARTTTTGCAVR
jgi:peroxiredoxin